MDRHGAETYGDPCRDCGYAWSLDLAGAREIVGAAPASYRALLEGHDGRERHAELRWSAAEYVCHVTDNLRIWAERMVAGGAVVQYDADALARARRYHRVPVEGALWSLSGAVAGWLAATNDFPDGIVKHETRGTLTVADVARGNAHDVTHHRYDIERSLAAGARPRRHRVLITGGARSGKSLEAERRLAGEAHVTYVATSLPRPGDASWAERVALHRERRPGHWRTVETVDLPPLLADPEAVLLIDCATLWLGAHIEAPDYAETVEALLAAWRGAACRVVLVTNEVGSSIHAETAAGRRFADELGRLNARLADVAEEVWLVVAGQPLQLKG